MSRRETRRIVYQEGNRVLHRNSQGWRVPAGVHGA